MASQQEHLSEPIIPPFFPASLKMHNQLNPSSIVIPDFLPSSKFIGPDALPEYPPSHLPALIATALKFTGFFHDPPDYECRLTLDDHALAGNLGYQSYHEWLMTLYHFFSLPLERSACQKQRLIQGPSIMALSYLISLIFYMIQPPAVKNFTIFALRNEWSYGF